MLLCSYTELKHSDLSMLRRKVREAGGRLMVTKNTLLRIALADNNKGGMEELLNGPTAATFTSADPAAVAKALSEFSKQFKGFQLKGAMLDKEILNGEQVVTLSKLPTRTELMGQLAGLLTRPLADIAQSLNELMAQIARQLDQIAAKA